MKHAGAVPRTAPTNLDTEGKLKQYLQRLDEANAPEIYLAAYLIRRFAVRVAVEASFR